MRLPTILRASTLVPLALGHTIFCQLKTDARTYDVSYAIRTPSYDGPQTDVKSNNLACNGPPNPTTPSSKIVDVQAGSELTAIWRHTLQSGSNDVMDSSHKVLLHLASRPTSRKASTHLVKGPVMAYLKKVSDATKDNGVGSGWFKIQHEGFNNGKWGTDSVINSGGNQKIHIPECIEDGQYLLRAEMVALHGARSTNGAQLYMECAQINITGGSGSKKPATASIPGIYKSNDPGLLIDIYNKPPSATNPYKIPGENPLNLSYQKMD
ncbi:uncharacterized protein JN550_004531 [Neoarthrinium moseri]|uniref:uncharacterized protein n=1 Tax=Neoarthrinium moseri TaxID=1658444 RepID=UPI001FDE77B1|nr:uncharacterized protein JN550_004531 [Neoarthrinium moseri]KAI1871537.1 hypothetical protein JN550_004531 [Neoarthrinium moseri]